jgi:queuine tRNA-ribosyltransferase
MPLNRFRLIKNDSCTKARLGVIETAHGLIETPAFMPVGTRGSVKTLTNRQLLEIGTQAIVGNAYHLMLRPGIDVIAKAGGLHHFMDWSQPILTDSGGFQVFSLASLNQVTDDGVYFQSHIDGSKHFLSPHRSMQIQKMLGADIIMAFDECTPYPGERSRVEEALEHTLRWAAQCRDFELQSNQSLFGIIHGGSHFDLRKQSAQAIVSLDFDGYAIGGLLEAHLEQIDAAIEAVEPLLPAHKPRYLMGIGTPRDIIEAVIRGIDLFDCVLPTRNARNGTAYTWSGKINIDAGIYADDMSPLDAELDSEASTFSKAYVRHLQNVKEITGLTLVTMQNLAFYLDFMHRLRQAIAQDNITEYYERICSLYPRI